MAVSIVNIRRNNDKVVLRKSYNLFVLDAICDELSNYARELELGNLRYFDGAGDCIFNYAQCQDILNIEIPALRTKNLSVSAQETLNGLEHAIKDSDDPYGFLLFEGA